MQGVKAMGYVEPTPIQSRTIPLILKGRDVIGSAQTGTGKTAAFALPILTRLDRHQTIFGRWCSSRRANWRRKSKPLFTIWPFHRAEHHGGLWRGRLWQTARGFDPGVDILVATPGRLLDHLGQGTCRLDRVEYLVLDEADRMLDMGFLPDVKRIVEKCPRQRHTSLFSATVPAEIETLIRWAMKDPEVVEIGLRRSPAETVRHAVYPVSDDQKTDLLCALLEHVNYDSVIVFCRTRRRADRLAIN